MKDQIVPILIALIAPLLAFLGVVWKLSGRISTSEASDLWEEARVIRQEYREEVKRFEERAAKCELELKALRNELQVVTARNTALSRDNRDLRSELRART